MSLADRRANAPHHLGAIPSFQIQTPNRSMRRLSFGSAHSLESQLTHSTLPEYNAEEDDNPDVITTSVEIDPDCEEESDTEISITPPAVVLSTTAKKSRKPRKSGLSKLFARNTIKPQTQAPGVRMTRCSQMLRTRSKDSRSGFPLSLPLSEGVPVVEINSDTWMQTISRVNILLSNRQTNDIQEILDSNEVLKDKVSLVKLSKAKSLGEYKTLVDPDTVALSSGLSRSASPSFLTIPELNPNELDDDEDDFSSYHARRRGSAVSTCSSSGSIKSSLSQRIKERLKKEEWCLMFD